MQLLLHWRVLIVLIFKVFTILLANGESQNSIVFNNSLSSPSEKWKRNWRNESDEVKLVYSDDHVAFYFSTNVDPSLQLPFDSLSWAWRYATETYGPFGNDSTLYFVISTGAKEGCTQSNWNSIVDPEFDYRLTIDCTRRSWGHDNRKHDGDLDYLMEQVGIKIQLVAKGTWNRPWKSMFNLNMFSILVYDIYKEIGNYFDINRWVTNPERHRTQFFFWFRKWYFYIYMNPGGGRVLNKYFSLVNLYWPKNGSDYVGQMNLGEFVHFWSGAKGRSLKIKAVAAFRWTREDSINLDKARRQYPQLNYSYQEKREGNRSLPQKLNTECYGITEEFTLVLSAQSVAFYMATNAYINITNASKVIADGWEYAKEQYGPFGQDTVLYILVCPRNKDVCSGPDTSSYFLRENDFQVIIQCTTSPSAQYMSDKDQAQLFVSNVINVLGDVPLSSSRETGNWPAVNVEEWEVTFPSIIQYDILLQLNLTDEANQLMTRMHTRAEKFPDSKDSIAFFQWYKPIYVQYGGPCVLKTFMSLLYTHWPREGHNYVQQMKLGDYVHFWSGAAGVNLWYLASDALAWSLVDHNDFYNAKAQYPSFNYSDTFPNTTNDIPSLVWEMDWAPMPHQTKAKLKLVHISKYVAIYFGAKVDPEINWPFMILDQAWRYSTVTYGTMGSDPLLYFVLHGDQGSFCLQSRQQSYRDSHFGIRTVIECMQMSLDDTKTDELLFEVGKAILRGVNHTGNWPARAISRWKMSVLIAFDVYMGIGMVDKAIKYANFQIRFPSDNAPREDSQWFKDWYYPIYALYGNTKVVQTFFSILHAHWPKTLDGHDYSKQMNVGEFLHFWSGAARTNLTYLAHRVFDWTDNYKAEYATAVASYPQLTYEEPLYKADVSQPFVTNEDWLGHENIIFLQYSDKYISIYFGGHVHWANRRPFEVLSQAWRWATSTYECIQNSPKNTLSIILHASSDSLCKSLWQRIPDNPNNEFNNLIDCQVSRLQNPWLLEVPGDSNGFTKAVADLIQEAANQTEGKKAYDGQPMMEMIVFDIYLRMGRIKEAHFWLTASISAKGSKSAGEIMWTQDWYLPIYNEFGGGSVLNAYFVLLASHLPTNPIITSSSRKQNVGETVHFWSSAAGDNLIYRANRVFGWTERYQKEFEDARKSFYSFNYSCYDCSIGGIAASDDSVTLAVSVTTSVLVLAFLTALYLWHRKKIKSLEEKIRELTTDELTEFFEGMREKDTSRGSSKEKSLALTEPFNKDFEIPRNQLDIYPDQVLGSGEFGLVLRGSITKVVDDETEVTTVAVKTVKSDVEIQLFKTLLAELKILSFLGSHANIASLVASVTVNIKQRELFVALEFCARGDLLNYVRKHRSNFKDLIFRQINNESSSRSTVGIGLESWHRGGISMALPHGNSFSSRQTNSPVIISTLDLLQWSTHISSGMQYISSKNIVHRDLAARNVLLTGNNVAKISDFGLSRQFETSLNYTQKSKTPLPWRWLAIESLRERKFSTKSDVWAFGVTLYEIFTLGNTPYSDYKWNREFVKHLASGLRLKRPKLGNDKVYHLMMDCMKEVPADRLGFADISRKLEAIKKKLPGDENSEGCNYSHFDPIYTLRTSYASIASYNGGEALSSDVPDESETRL